LHAGTTALADDEGNKQTVAIQTHVIPASVTLHKGSVESFISAVVASVGQASGFDIKAAAAEEHASAVAEQEGLLTEHAAAWSKLWRSRVEVEGAADSPRAWDVQTHVYSSLYYLQSSIRADWTLGGLSPGGLASQNYEGAVFMDQELYMAQGLLLFHPELTLSAAQYRIDGAEAAAKVAKVFGYKGLMYPWTSAANGYPFGCCNGQGGFENCIEQHITPDVAFFMQVWHVSSSSSTSTTTTITTTTTTTTTSSSSSSGSNSSSSSSSSNNSSSSSSR
jgi:trehalose/maltose hydrolase-like predicted phosphorylase